MSLLPSKLLLTTFVETVIFPYDIQIDSNDQDWRHTRNYIMDDVGILLSRTYDILDSSLLQEIHDIIVKPLSARCSLTVCYSIHISS